MHICTYAYMHIIYTHMYTHIYIYTYTSFIVIGTVTITSIITTSVITVSISISSSITHVIIIEINDIAGIELWHSYPRPCRGRFVEQSYMLYYTIV